MAGTWAFAFYKILIDGSVKFYEPNPIILITEFSVVILVTLFFVATLWWVIANYSKRL